MDRRTKGHYCVDYCSPPEHADLCHSNTDWSDDYAAHFVFEDTYWQLYRVAVTKVQRLPDLDGDKPQTDLHGRKVSQVNLYDSNSPTHYAYMVRWRGDLQRERNRYKRNHDFRNIYGKPCPASCPTCRGITIGY